MELSEPGPISHVTDGSTKATRSPHVYDKVWKIILTIAMIDFIVTRKQIQKIER